MKILLILSVILCVTLSIRAAAVVTADADAAAVKEENNSSLKSARFSFCLDGWLSFRGNCYYLSNNVDTWRNAESFCAGYGGSLASAHNIWEYNFLQRVVNTGGHTFAWIGGYFFEGDWRWEDGSEFNFHHWETLSSTDHYQCLQVDSQGSRGWSNHGCSMSFPFVCQVKPNC
ncbi:ladderlectin-like isoform X2 [Eleginops maclovinus]|uniref:ladderlectin-like isoform X2 n=1 Tax=Eleginops maclovinus TaxID=56733 RepID=UPI003080644C